MANAARAIASFRARIKKHRTGKKKYRFVMDEFTAGRLHTSYGVKVTNPAQARAIAFSMAIRSKPKKVRARIYKKLKKIRAAMGR